MKRPDLTPQQEPRDTSLSRRARLQVLLSQGAALGAAILTALPDVKIPKIQGE